jgi:hypothetical protein
MGLMSRNGYTGVSFSIVTISSHNFSIMTKNPLLLLTLTANLTWVHAQMLPWIPITEPQDESLLLEAALEVEPEILEGGYRQYDLTVARMTTWGEEEKDQQLLL